MHKRSDWLWRIVFCHFIGKRDILQNVNAECIDLWFPCNSFHFPTQNLLYVYMNRQMENHFQLVLSMFTFTFIVECMYVYIYIDIGRLLLMWHKAQGYCPSNSKWIHHLSELVQRIWIFTIHFEMCIFVDRCSNKQEDNLIVSC